LQSSATPEKAAHPSANISPISFIEWSFGLPGSCL
jgi:hypothetical protein